MELEYKLGGAEFKAGAQDGDYEGYFSVTGNVDDGGDVIEPGAFKKTLAERGSRLRVFWGHDPLRPIGPPPSVAVEDSRGLFVKGRLSVDSFWGREAWVLLKDGALTEGSIGYRSIPARTEWKDGHRHLYEVKLFEVSFVAIGMNPETALQAVKSWTAGGGPVGYYQAMFQHAATGLEQISNDPTVSYEDCEQLVAVLEVVLQGAKNLCAAVAPVQATYLGHSALQLKERAVRLGLSLVH